MNMIDTLMYHRGRRLYSVAGDSIAGFFYQRIAHRRRVKYSVSWAVRYPCQVHALANRRQVCRRWAAQMGGTE